jgi:hypothetical protein
MRLEEYVNFHLLLPLFSSVVLDNGVVAVVASLVVIDVVVGLLVVVDVVVVGAENTITYIYYICTIKTE